MVTYVQGGTGSSIPTTGAGLGGMFRTTGAGARGLGAAPTQVVSTMDNARARLASMQRAQGLVPEDIATERGPVISTQDNPPPPLPPAKPFEEHQFDAGIHLDNTGDNTYDDKGFDPWDHLFGDEFDLALEVYSYDTSVKGKKGMQDGTETLKTIFEPDASDPDYLWYAGPEYQLYPARTIPGYVPSQESEDFIRSVAEVRRINRETKPVTGGGNDSEDKRQWEAEKQARWNAIPGYNVGHNYHDSLLADTSFRDDNPIGPTFEHEYQQGLADGGEVMQPQEVMQNQGPSPEDEEFIQLAIAALDQESPMDDDDRKAILDEFEARFGEGSVEELIDSMGEAEQGPPVEGFSEGGFAEGVHSPTTDTAPAMLTPGEYVLPTAVVENIGVQNLDDLVEGTTGVEPGGRPIDSSSIRFPLANMNDHRVNPHTNNVSGFAFGGMAGALGGGLEQSPSTATNAMVGSSGSGYGPMPQTNQQSMIGGLGDILRQQSMANSQYGNPNGLPQSIQRGMMSSAGDGLGTGYTNQQVNPYDIKVPDYFGGVREQADSQSMIGGLGNALSQQAAAAPEQARFNPFSREGVERARAQQQVQHAQNQARDLADSSHSERQARAQNRASRVERRTERQAEKKARNAARTERKTAARAAKTERKNTKRAAKQARRAAKQARRA